MKRALIVCVVIAAIFLESYAMLRWRDRAERRAGQAILIAETNLGRKRLENQYHIFAGTMTFDEVKARLARLDSRLDGRVKERLAKQDSQLNHDD
jgi:guanylate kinase